MGLRVTTNVAALNAHRTLAQTDHATTASLRRLSTGLRIAGAADDATGLGISEGLRSQIGGMTQAVRNTGDGIDLLRTADGALDGTSALLRRMRDLAVQAGNTGSLDARARAAVRTEFEQLKRELDDIARTTYNGTPLLDGSYDRVFQVGADAGETVRVVISTAGRGVDTAGLGLEAVDVTGGSVLPHTVAPAVSDDEGTPAPGRLTLTGDFVAAEAGTTFEALVGRVHSDGRSFDLASVDYTGAVTTQDHLDRLNTAAVAALGTTYTPFVGTATGLVFTGETPGRGSTQADAVALTPAYTGDAGTSGALRAIDRAIGRVSSLRAYIGAVDNRFSHRVDRLGTAIENAMASESRIRDTDVAAETTALARNQVLAQAGTAMLAQANQAPGLVLRLLS